jgi:3-hydroxymyristoyl/3-hydroxydecanoyl-(acyl carrier protein) dehydratase
MQLLLNIAPAHPAFAGHFPGQPLLPGVSLVAEVLEAILGDSTLAAIVGPTPRISAVKFLSPVRPGAQLMLKLDSSERAVRFEIREGERLAASGQFEGSP